LKDYRVRLFYFVFAVLLHNIWRLTDFLLEAAVDGPIEYAPVMTAGEVVELVSADLIPADQAANSLVVHVVDVGGNTIRLRLRG
jgi:hypothetical protein